MYKDCYKQFLYPTYTEKQKLSHAKYLEIIEQLSICQIDKINIIPATIEKKRAFFPTCWEYYRKEISI